MKNLILATALSTLAFHVYADDAVPADANTPSSTHRDITVDGKISTLGLGVEAVFPMTQSVDARIGLNAFNFTLNKSSDASPGKIATNYSGNFDLQSFQALADWHPWQSSFRVSGGLVYNNNQFKMTATPVPGKNIIYINGNPYSLTSAISANPSVDASIDFRKIAPYLGIGWGRTPKNTGLSFTSDIGILFQGTPNSNVTTNITGVTSTDITQANAQLQDSVKNYNIYPVISVGIGYSF